MLPLCSSCVIVLVILVIRHTHSQGKYSQLEPLKCGHPHNLATLKGPKVSSTDKPPHAVFRALPIGRMQELYVHVDGVNNNTCTVAIGNS